jgi:hypothetical protein
MAGRMLRFLFLATLPGILPGCLFMGFVCGVAGGLLQAKYPDEDICPLFDGDCCSEDESGPYRCGKPNDPKVFPCGSLHFIGCACTESSGTSRVAADVSRVVTYDVPPFTFDLKLPFAGFESAQHLSFPVVTGVYQTFSGTVTYGPGFTFHGFTALGPADAVIGSYGMDVKSTGTIDFSLPIRASSVDLAYADVDGNGQRGALDPTIEHHADTPIAGAHTFVLALPAGGDTVKGFARSFLAFTAHVTLAAGILGNPTVAGSYDVDGTFTSVDPDSGDADDDTGLAPLVATAPTHAIAIEESPIALVDHFLCYKTKPSKGLVCSEAATMNRGALCTTDADCGGAAGVCVKNKFPKGVQTTLADRFTAFAARTVDVKKPLRLCAPAEANGAGRHDGVTHMRGYQIAVAKTAPKPSVVPNLAVVNQLGTIVVDIKAPDGVYVPVAKALGAPAPTLGPNTVDHYECYKAKLRTKRCAGAPTRACKSDLACGIDGPCLGKFPKGLQISVADQFTNGTKVFDVKKPTRLCTPALLDGSPIQSPGGELMCYQVKPAAGAPKHAPLVGTVHTTGVLGHERLDILSEDELCVPSLELTTP